MIHTVSSAWFIAERDYPADADAAFALFTADSEDAAWIDGRWPLGRVADERSGEACRADFSLWCVRPLATIEQFDGAAAELRIGGRLAGSDRCAWRLWREVSARLPSPPPAPTGVGPGWVGCLGFEMVRQLERLPASHREDLGLPLFRLMLCDCARVLDHRRRRAFDIRAHGVASGLGLPAGRGEADEEDPPAPVEPAAAERAAAPASIEAEMTREEFEQRVRAALDYIGAGDIYQVNLAQRFRLGRLADPLASFARLRRRNPSAYGALVRWRRGAVISASPELFLSCDGDHVLTRPIKGTRPRGSDPRRDAERLAELLASEKDAAELAMIVDLHRNDLGRTCRFGSIRVAEPRGVEAHPGVWHTAADIVGRLRPGVGTIELLMSCFPAGSVTGVPKIRALQIIDELEPAARGMYTGAVGVVGLDGSASVNVAIRTVQQCGDRGSYYAGAGIVADSEPAAEYEETLAKARGVLGVIAAGGVFERPRCAGAILS